MDCDQFRELIDADVDGELDLVRHLELAAHARTCPECARLAEVSRNRRKALQSSLPRFTAPTGFADRIRASLRAEAGAPKPSADQPGRVIRWSFAPALGLAAGFAVALLAGYQWGHTRRQSELLVGDAISSHVRSLEAAHLTDVTSTDRHTVKPWFAGKLDFSPPVVDLAADGYPLAGGRLEYFEGRRAAALVFMRRQHAINLFIWPSGASSIARMSRQESGYQVESWSEGGMDCLAVSEIPKAELAQFAALFQQKSQ